MKHYRITYRDHIEYVSCERMSGNPLGQSLFENKNFETIHVAPKSALVVDVTNQYKALYIIKEVESEIQDYFKSINNKIFDDRDMNKEELRQATFHIRWFRDSLEKFIKEKITINTDTK